MPAHPALARLTARHALTETEAQALFDDLMDGRLDSHVVAAVLAALATKGETVAELVGAARALRARATPVRVPPGVDAIDTCGTGGDGQPVFNVSTAVAIVAAAAGATVAKHGNRSNARPSGSAEVLAALGVNIDADVPTLERCLAQCRIAFLFAVQLHPAMKHAAPVRRALGIRTIFNWVGPLTNPAGVRRQLLGVSRPEAVEMLLNALIRLGAERALVVHGLEGLCDLSVTAPTRVGRWDGRSMTTEEVDVGVIGAAPARLADLCIGSPEESAAVIRAVLAGRPGPAREMVVFNAAAALWVAGRVAGWLDGAAAARQAIDSGAAAALLDTWIATSHNRA